MTIYDMIRNGNKVAAVITLDNGKCIVAWPTSTVLYDSEEAAYAVHVEHMGGRGERTQFEFVWASHPNVKRGRDDCYQDSCENAHFSSVGGLENRSALRVPEYIASGSGEIPGGLPKHGTSALRRGLANLRFQLDASANN